VDAEKDNRSLLGLILDLQKETTLLISHEFALARAEMRERMVQLALGVGFLAAATVVSFVGLLIVLMGVSELVAEFMPEVLRLWLGYLIVGGIVLAAGVFLLLRGIRNLQSSGELLSRTAESVGRDVQMVKERVRQP
jgi:hypothetical protein